MHLLAAKPLRCGMRRHAVPRQVLVCDNIGLLSIFSITSGRLMATKRVTQQGVAVTAISKVMDRQLYAVFTNKDCTVWHIGALNGPPEALRSSCQNLHSGMPCKRRVVSPEPIISSSGRALAQRSLFGPGLLAFATHAWDGPHP